MNNSRSTEYTDDDEESDDCEDLSKYDLWGSDNEDENIKNIVQTKDKNSGLPSSSSSSSNVSSPESYSKDKKHRVSTSPKHSSKSVNPRRSSYSSNRSPSSKRLRSRSPIHRRHIKD